MGYHHTEVAVMPINCLDCGQTLRAHHLHAHLYPGTVLHGGNGRCTTCRRKERAEAAEAAKPKIVNRILRRDDDEDEAAVRQVCAHADSSEDAKTLLTMLGFYETPEERMRPLTALEVLGGLTGNSSRRE